MRTPKRPMATVVNQGPRVGRPHGREARRDPRLPPPTDDEDDYTIGLLGSEGSSFTPVILTKTQLRFLLSLEDRINRASRGYGYQPELVVYYGGVVNVGTKEDPVWEPKGQRVQRPRV